MTSRRSSGSSRDESAVEPMRSQNITLSGRRSAVVSDEPRLRSIGRLVDTDRDQQPALPLCAARRLPPAADDDGR